MIKTRKYSVDSNEEKNLKKKVEMGKLCVFV